MLDYMSDSKGVIRYEKINSFHDLDAVPNQDGFFAKTEFYSTLRNQIKSGDQYECIRKFWNLLQLRKLSDLNEFYNLQDSIILCETFEKRTEEIMKKLPYNPLKCTSASSLSDSMHGYSLEVLILFPTRQNLLRFSKQLSLAALAASILAWLSNRKFQSKGGRR